MEKKPNLMLEARNESKVENGETNESFDDLLPSAAKGPSTYYVILYTVFYVKRVTFFLVNRVEHQKLNQTTAELPFGWVFVVQLDLIEKKLFD